MSKKLFVGEILSSKNGKVIQNNQEVVIEVIDIKDGIVEIFIDSNNVKATLKFCLNDLIIAALSGEE